MLLKRKFRKISVLSFSIAGFLAISSCIRPNDPNPEDLYGRWKLLQIDATLDENSAPTLEKQKDYQNEALYFEFLRGEIFATNTDLGLNKLLLKESEVITGEYAFDENNTGQFIELTFDDPQYNREIMLRFEIVDLDSESPSLVMNTQNYITSLRTSANGLPTEIRDALYQFTNRINEANFSLTFTKNN